MSHSIRSIFDTECPNFKVDLDLVKRIEKYKFGFMNRNEE